MDLTERTQDVVLRYWRSWQDPSDFTAFRSCLADEVVFDSGTQTLSGADALTVAVETTESPWKSVKMLASMFGEDEAAILYEGVDKRSGIKTRVAEHLTVRGDRITRIIAAIAPVVPAGDV